MKKKFLITIMLLIAAGLSGCGVNLLKEENEPESHEVIEADSLFSDDSAEETSQEHAEPNQNTSQEQTETAQEPTTSQNALEAGSQDKFWYEKYKAFVDDWTLVDDYGDLSYLRMYFGEDFAFNSYWLCDVDNNGTPELFLHEGIITAVLTCTEEQAVFLFYNDIYGINPETDEIVISGHWHGAGGSGDNEWSAFQVSGDKAEYSMYIDYFDFSADGEPNRYTVYDPQTGEYKDSTDGTEYDELYAVHVEPCIPVENYTKYDLSDFSGLDNVQ